MKNYCWYTIDKINKTVDSVTIVQYINSIDGRKRQYCERYLQNDKSYYGIITEIYDKILQNNNSFKLYLFCPVIDMSKATFGRDMKLYLDSDNFMYIDNNNLASKSILPIITHYLDYVFNPDELNKYTELIENILNIVLKDSIDESCDYIEIFNGLPGWFIELAEKNFLERFNIHIEYDIFPKSIIYNQLYKNMKKKWMSKIIDSRLNLNNNISKVSTYNKTFLDLNNCIPILESLEYSKTIMYNAIYYNPYYLSITELLSHNEDFTVSEDDFDMIYDLDNKLKPDFINKIQYSITNLPFDYILNIYPYSRFGFYKDNHTSEIKNYIDYIYKLFKFYNTSKMYYDEIPIINKECNESILNDANLYIIIGNEEIKYLQIGKNGNISDIVISKIMDNYYISNNILINDDGDIYFDKEQMLAIKMGISNNIAIITGGPGTGKSDIMITTSIGRTHLLNEQVFNCSFTGKAVINIRTRITLYISYIKNIDKSNPKHAIIYTIMKLFSISKEKLMNYLISILINTRTINNILSNNYAIDENGEAIYHLDPKTSYKNYEPIFNPNKSQCFLFDESSMIDVNLVGSLLHKYNKKKKMSMIFYGDKDQLPPIKGTNLLSQILKTPLKRFYLKKSHRTAEYGELVKIINIIQDNDINMISLMKEEINRQSSRTDCSLTFINTSDINCDIGKEISNIFIKNKNNVSIICPKNKHIEDISVHVRNMNPPIIYPYINYIEFTKTKNSNEKTITFVEGDIIRFNTNIYGLYGTILNNVTGMYSNKNYKCLCTYQTIEPLSNYSDKQSLNNALAAYINPSSKYYDLVKMIKFTIYNGEEFEIIDFKHNPEDIECSNISLICRPVNLKFIRSSIDYQQLICIPCEGDVFSTNNVSQAKCITVHKSQGSESDVVIIYLPQDCFPSKFIYSNLLYTAITRAKRAVYCLIHDKDNFFKILKHHGHSYKSPFVDDINYMFCKKYKTRDLEKIRFYIEYNRPPVNF